MFLNSRPWLAVATLVVSGAAWSSDAVDAISAAEFGAPMAVEMLESQRGRQAQTIELNLQENKATMQQTAVGHGSETGTNTISGGAFGGANGFPLAVQNSGNNVIIQNAFIINLDLK
jgi:hypothetical protein